MRATPPQHLLHADTGGDDALPPALHSDAPQKLVRAGGAYIVGMGLCAVRYGSRGHSARVESDLARQNIQTVAHSVEGGGIASGALAKEAVAADLLTTVGDEVEVFGYGGLQLMAVDQGWLNVGAHALLGGFGSGQELTHEAVGLECLNVAVGDSADAEHGDVLLPEQSVKGDVGGDGQLAADIVAVYVRGGISLGIAQLLCLLQNVGERNRGSVHSVHDEVGGAVHDAAQLGDGVQPLAPFQIGQPRNAPAYGGGAAQGYTVFRCQLDQLRVKGADDRFVGGNHMLAGAQRGANILIGRVQTAHDLDDDADSGIVRDGGYIRHRQTAQLRPFPPHQHLGNGEIRPLRAEI